MSLVFSHSYKGTTWKKHKYVRKEGGKYYYPKNSSKGKTTSGRTNTLKSISDIDPEELSQMRQDHFNAIISSIREEKMLEAEKKENLEKPFEMISRAAYEARASINDFMHTPVKDFVMDIYNKLFK